MGGLANILSNWELEAREDQLPEQLIQAVIARLRDYHHLSEESREVVLKGVWQRLTRETGISDDPDEADESIARTEEPADTVLSESQEGAEADGEAPALESLPAVTPVQEQAPPPAPPAAPQQPPEPPPGLDFDAPLETIKGIGAKREEALERMGIHTVNDLLYTFPRRHDDYSQLKPISKLWYGDDVTIIGTVKKVATRSVRSGKMKIVEAQISDKSGAIRATWFNQPWMEGQLKKSKQVVLSGVVDQYLGRLVMNNPEWEPLSPKQLHTNRIVPVYPLTRDITQKWLRKVIHGVVENYAPYKQDPLPEPIRESSQLPPLPEALRQIHFPDSGEDLQKARQRLAFDELFLLQMGVLEQKKQWESRSGEVFDSPQEWLEAQLQELPFELTAAQRNALDQVRGDLRSGTPMNRLLQGDVGSGKTVIAALAALIVNRGEGQAAFLAPTSILAEQHFQSLTALLVREDPSGLKEGEIRLLIGATPESDKAEIREGLANGAIQLVVGTHALLQDPVSFKNLQLAVVDEQHRFGVEQRAILRQKGANPHLLVMTATPIPRSLALTMYGDLELSIIDELPPGRQPIETHILFPRELERAYGLIRGQVDLGNQAFIIYPLVEESEKIDGKAAVEEFERLQKEVFSTYQLGLLHGQMSADDKEAVMTRFRDKQIQILVSTTVVEVGVDIPDATVMLVEGADRFGLAQLHQLRGRVGRGSQKSYCILVPGSAEDVENQRLQAMKETNNGFILAEKDLAIRGPGQFLGTRQSGYTQLKLASITDLKLVEQARAQATALFQQDPDLSQEGHRVLAQAVERFWSRQSAGDIS